VDEAVTVRKSVEASPMKVSAVEPNLARLVEAETVRLVKERPVPCPWTKRIFWKEDEAVVEVAVMVPARRLPMVEVDRTPTWAKRYVDVAWVEVERLNVWPPVQVLGLARFKEATTFPVVGETVRVPSEFATEPTPVTRQEPLIAKHPVVALMPFAKVEVPVPPTLMMPEVWRLPSVVVAIPTPRPPER